ncbi:MAG: hypothetical protein Q8P17_02610 [bacterium]|nr:hypothetical protein [bacterium]
MSAEGPKTKQEKQYDQESDSGLEKKYKIARRWSNLIREMAGEPYLIEIADTDTSVSEVRKNQIIKIICKDGTEVVGRGPFVCDSDQHHGEAWIHFLNGKKVYKHSGENWGMRVSSIKNIEKVG